MDIEILEMRLLSGDKPLRAFADIQIDDWLTIRDWRIVKRQGKAPQVIAPETTWKNAEGEIQHKTIVVLSDEMRGQVDLAILNYFIKKVRKTDEQSKKE